VRKKGTQLSPFSERGGREAEKELVLSPVMWREKKKTVWRVYERGSSFLGGGGGGGRSYYGHRFRQKEKKREESIHLEAKVEGENRSHRLEGEGFPGSGKKTSFV